MAIQSNRGAFVPTTSVWDVGNLYDVDVTSVQFKELLVRMYQNLNLMANVLNVKDTGYYDTVEYVCGQQYFPRETSNSQSNPYIAPAYRPVFRTVVNFGALPNAATKSVPHNIILNSSYMFTRIYATATDTTGLTALPIPYSSTTAVADNIELYVDSTNVNIKTGINRTNYNECVVIVEYLKF